MKETTAYIALKRALPNSSFCFTKKIWRHVYEGDGRIEVVWDVWVDGLGIFQHKTLGAAVAAALAVLEPETVTDMESDRELQETTPC